MDLQQENERLRALLERARGHIEMLEKRLQQAEQGWNEAHRKAQTLREALLEKGNNRGE